MEFQDQRHINKILFIQSPDSLLGKILQKLKHLMKEIKQLLDQHHILQKIQITKRQISLKEGQLVTHKESL
jgi:hypothetical protein